MLQATDSPFYADQARTEWAYQIVDGGAKTGLWVAGLSTNHRGWLGYSADGRCAIYTSNPLDGKGRLDGQKPIDNAKYTCSATSEFVSLDGSGVVSRHINRHFDSVFVVSRK